MDVTDPNMPDPDRNRPNTELHASKPVAPLDAEPIDGTRKLGLLKRAMIRLRHRRLTNRELWDLRVRFDSLIAANSWNLARNIDELNERYPS